MYKRQSLNYITIVLALSTIGMAIYTIKTRENMIWSLSMLVITIISNYISNKISQKDINLTKEDKKILNTISKSKKVK